MKLDNASQGTVLASSGVQSTSAFNIARTPHMFTILSSGLYSDKISAVLREIGCNATDAHIMSGQPDLPIQVKLPSPLDRSFYIKDWGTGLDDREVTELYTTYGWSSKQSNDDVTGAFGLGSKSPFAYTLQNEEDADGFTIESAKDGIKRIYTCHIAESGAPAISRLYEGPSDPDWPHGIKVSFPVQTRHIDEFHERAKDVYRWFRVAPEFLGLNGVVPELKYAVRTENFGLQPETNRHSGACVVMGNVSYPIDGNKLRDLVPTERALLNASITLWVPMGTVMMTPSREGLEYTDKTRNGLHTHLEAAAQAVAKRIFDEVTLPAASTWEWYKRIQMYYTSLPFGVSRELGGFLQKAGMAPDECKRVLEVVTTNIATLPAWVGSPRLTPCEVWYYRTHATRESTISRKRVTYGKMSNGSESTAIGLAFKENVEIFYVDSKGADQRLRHAVRSGQLACGLMVKGPTPEQSREYAELISNSAELEGLPCKGTGTLEVPEVSVEEQERRKSRRGKTPAQLCGELDSLYLDVSQGTSKEISMKLKDIVESGKYYLCQASAGRRGRSHKIWNTTSAGHFEISRYDIGACTHALNYLLPLLDTPITGYVTVKGEAAVKRLKLDEQGFKPLLPALQAGLEDPDTWSALTVGYSPIPNIRPSDFYYMKQMGWVGVLGFNVSQSTNFGLAFSRRFQGHALLADVMRLLSGNEEESRAISALRTLGADCSGLKLPTTMAVLGTYEIKDTYLKKYPGLAFLEAERAHDLNTSQSELLIQLLESACTEAASKSHLALIAA